MKHAASRELFAYWQEKRGTRPAPERAEIDPGAIRGLLGDAFILALDQRRTVPRLLGRVQPVDHGRVVVDPIG